MANHGTFGSKKTLTPESLGEMLEEVVRRRLGDQFEVRATKDVVRVSSREEGIFCVYMWLKKSGRKVEFRYPHGEFMCWVLYVLVEELAKALGGVVDSGRDPYKPDPTRWPTFRDYMKECYKNCRASHGEELFERLFDGAVSCVPETLQELARA